MATRTHVREAVIGLLYAHDIGNDQITAFVDEILEDKKIRNKQKEFALTLFNGVLNNIEILDKNISIHLAKRGIADLGLIEKSILRLAVYEILFKALDKAIAINEAIELSKRFSNDSAPKFINAVLDNIEV